MKNKMPLAQEFQTNRMNYRNLFIELNIQFYVTEKHERFNLFLFSTHLTKIKYCVQRLKNYTH